MLERELERFQTAEAEFSGRTITIEMPEQGLDTGFRSVTIRQGVRSDYVSKVLEVGDDIDNEIYTDRPGDADRIGIKSSEEKITLKYDDYLYADMKFNLR